eukprot:CAMPEP_0184990002 /NCGR_PEP_ID=MMETSP1098-20130426/30612_1 /TAXON_ID=89044 /ORGANISM="Spumella elongata, Strain CCAP 955/1" /LENGTH=127 /DNA_ID=CAMNT_0027515119 /DNA_START=208 /DNA_END=588 /DNA_ORIENTATION=-
MEGESARRRRSVGLTQRVCRGYKGGLRLATFIWILEDLLPSKPIEIGEHPSAMDSDFSFGGGVGGIEIREGIKWGDSGIFSEIPSYLAEDILTPLLNNEEAVVFDESIINAGQLIGVAVLEAVHEPT